VSEALTESDLTVRGALARHGLVHELMPCDPELADTAAFCAAYGIAPEDSANTIVVVGKSDPPVYAACLVLATTRLDVNGLVRQRFGVRKASFADSETTVTMTKMIVGGVTIVGVPESLPIWIDSQVMDRAEVIVGGGSRSWKIRCAPAELLKLPNVEVVDGLAKAPPPVPT
jgi:prolyl-tRNA editing enzyme YbaK/EbsC (Cys-tRNA(Pro) deacylase)